jgi:NAD(P)-dependent dehydrogenase (short-subunit alcohol dehydrogenase family)
MRVVLADVETAALESAEREMRDGAEVLAVQTDVSKPEQVQSLADKTLEHFGGVHIVCNNAGVGATKLAWDEALDDWRWVLGVNLWGVINGVRTFAPIMLERGQEGHIVNTASVAGLIVGGGASAYTTSKYAVVGLTEVLYHEMLMASKGRLGVSLLCPAATDTRIMDSDRNRPAGPTPEAAAGTPEAIGRDFVRRLLKEGQSPAQIAGHVFDAIVEQRFYVLTHPEHNAAIRRRTESMLSGAAPVALGLE